MEYYDAYGEFRGFETPRWNADSEVICGTLLVSNENERFIV